MLSWTSELRESPSLSFITSSTCTSSGDGTSRTWESTERRFTVRAAEGVISRLLVAHAEAKRYEMQPVTSRPRIVSDVQMRPVKLDVRASTELAVPDLLSHTMCYTRVTRSLDSRIGLLSIHSGPVKN